MIIKSCFLILIFGCAAIVQADEVATPPSGEPVAPPDLKRLAGRIEPSLVGKPDRLPQYVDFFCRELGNDKRICAFDVTAKPGRANQVELSGFVEFPETRASLAKFLEALGFQVEDRMESLPAENLGKEVFGLVKASHSLCYDRPSGRRKQENDCLLGEPLLLLREQDGQLLAHSREGYLGYVASADVMRVDGAAYEKYLSGPRVLVTADQKKDGDHPEVPAGARLKWISTKDNAITAALPTGETVQLPADACKVCEVPAAKIDAIIATAQKLIGTPYFWGGRTSAGIDCSGLVQMGYASAGLFLPRDAYQQFYIGQLTATRWHMAGLRRGDTLYFLADDGKIRHTALYIGNDHYLQAVTPVVRISSFNPKDPEYDAHHHKCFAFAKRLLD